VTEFDSVKLLRGVLRTHLDWHGARLDFLARFILALLQVRSVNLARLAPVLSAKAKTSSNYIRLQRFFRGFTIAQADLARTVAWLLLPQERPWVLTLDRTNWKLGRAELNLLVLAVSYRGLSIPLFWNALPKAGNSNTAERVALIGRLRETFPVQPLAYLLADREFIGGAWVAALRAHQIPFRLRLKANARIRRTRLEQEIPLLREFQDLRVHEQRVLRKPRWLWGQSLFLSAKRLEDGEWLLIASDTYSALALDEYAERWTIETLFAALKTHGFHLEDTHLTKPERLENLLGLLTLASIWAVHAGLWAHAHQPIRLKKHCSDRSFASSAMDSTCSSASSPNASPSALNSYACSAFSLMGSHWNFTPPSLATCGWSGRRGMRAR
jgi:hypothetical protein